jgi:hypothetical protein
MLTYLNSRRTWNNVCTVYQQLHCSYNLLIHCTAPTCFDVCTSSYGSLLLCVLLSCIKMSIVMIYAKKSLHSMVVVNKTLQLINHLTITLITLSY